LDGRIQITVEARDDAGKPDTTLTLRGGITMPGALEGTSGPRQTLKFVQRNAGVYVAEVKAEDSGSYFITAQATRMVKPRNGVGPDIEEGVDTVRTGITIPHTREYSTPESNLPLMKRLASTTGGLVYDEDDQELTRIATQGVPFRSGLPHTGALQPL